MINQSRHATSSLRSRQSGTAKIIVISVVSVLIGGAIVFAWQQYELDRIRNSYDDRLNSMQEQVEQLSIQVQGVISEEDEVTGTSEENTLLPLVSNSATAMKCAFDASIYNELTAGRDYDMFGNEEFDTVVCGYLVTGKNTSEATGKTVDVAYFRVLDISTGFKNAVDQAIIDGNTVNRKIGNNLDIRLGCIENNELVTNDAGDTDELDSATSQAILNSTEANPINLILSFEEESGQGILCDSLADTIQLVE
jgi:hypothetical protein